MAVIGTFGSFTAARLGIYASQSSLNVTGNNIANINTEGYTRQRADLVSLHSYGDARYANSFNLNIGYGVLIDSISQLRDPFLDIRYRNENSNVGAADEKLDCLQQLSHILDEVGKGRGEFGIIEGQFDDFIQQLQSYNGKVGSVEYDTTVRGSAETLVRLFNDYSKAMDTLEVNKLQEMKEDVKTVNTLLTEIRDLSEEIREAGIHGDKALELRDARNVRIDKLSAYMKIDVKYDMEKIDEFNSVERINISIANSGTPPIKLIQGIYGAQISMPDKAPARNPDYDPDLPTSNLYISQESDLENGKVLYTHNLREALRDDKGDAITNNKEGQDLLDAMTQAGGTPPTIPVDGYYNADLVSTGKYLIYDPDGNVIGRTNDPNDTMNGRGSTMVDNAVEGSTENRLWMTVEPLKDARGKFMRDQYHKEITESVDLADNQLYGSLQSTREFLTEKGEFASDDDIKFDEDATHKRGIQYYKLSLDALARKFAEEFNNANRLNFGQVSQAYYSAEANKLDDKGDPIQATDKDGNPVTDGGGNPVYEKVTVFLDAKGNEITDADGKRIIAEDFDELATDIAEIEDLQAKCEAISKDQKLTAAEKKTQLEPLQTRIQELQEKGDGLEARKEVAYKNMETLRLNGQLTQEWAFYDGGVLFSNNGDTNDATNIDAGNITISKDWSTGDTRILNTKKPDILIEDPNGGPDKVLSHTTADDNILHMINLMNYDFDYLPNEIVDNAEAGGTKKYFTGSFQERLADINSILAVEQETTSTLYSTYAINALTLENSRQSVSGVDLNDEATNMMVFQKAYTAACTLMTTLDSMLDKLINNTIR